MGVIGIKYMQEASAFFKEKMESEESEETEMYIDTQGIRGRRWTMGKQRRGGASPEWVCFVSCLTESAERNVTKGPRSGPACQQDFLFENEL